MVVEDNVAAHEWTMVNILFELSVLAEVLLVNWRRWLFEFDVRQSRNALFSV